MTTWYFQGASGPLGPVPAAALLQLVTNRRVGLETQVAPADPTAAQAWVPLKDAPGVGRQAQLKLAQWFYRGEDGEQVGPLSVEVLAQHFQDGELDGLTVTWCALYEAWTPLGQLHELRPLLQGGDVDEDVYEDGPAHDDYGTLKAADMVFAPPAQPRVRPEVRPAAPDSDDDAPDADDMASASDRAVEAPPTQYAKEHTRSDGVREVWDAKAGAWREVPPDASAAAPAAAAAAAPAAAAAAAPAAAAATPAPAADDIDAVLRAAAAAGGEATASDSDADTDTAAADERRAKKKAARAKRKAGWSEKRNKTWIYVQGLPLDVTEDEVRTWATKAGVLATDPVTGGPKLKLYRIKPGSDGAGTLQGDASVCYNNASSVDLALEMLHESYLRADGKDKLSVER